MNLYKRSENKKENKTCWYNNNQINVSEAKY